ncbi:hypothetical protein BD311DRAFT_748864 [Dichomitus squalens]|uniref:Uncharacterized protein n=1 Tax=Dichomitus squalens TaxID=114155 RepID=A0A4Q9MZH5_9APHY|nr:hypothetical protein BD311DRAFT_748864 [Dichomitus squalens]
MPRLCQPLDMEEPAELYTMPCRTSPAAAARQNASRDSDATSSHPSLERRDSPHTAKRTHGGNAAIGGRVRHFSVCAHHGWLDRLFVRPSVRSSRAHCPRNITICSRSRSVSPPQRFDERNRVSTLHHPASHHQLFCKRQLRSRSIARESHWRRTDARRASMSRIQPRMSVARCVHCILGTRRDIRQELGSIDDGTPGGDDRACCCMRM